MPPTTLHPQPLPQLKGEAGIVERDGVACVVTQTRSTFHQLFASVREVQMYHAPPLPQAKARPVSSTATAWLCPAAMVTMLQPASVVMTLGVGCGSYAILMDAAQHVEWRLKETNPD